MIMQSCLLTACHTRVTSSSAYISLCKYEIDNFEAKLLLLFYGNLQIEFFSEGQDDLFRKLPINQIKLS